MDVTRFFTVYYSSRPVFTAISHHPYGDGATPSHAQRGPRACDSDDYSRRKRSEPPSRSRMAARAIRDVGLLWASPQRLEHLEAETRRTATLDALVAAAHADLIRIAPRTHLPARHAGGSSRTDMWWHCE